MITKHHEYATLAARLEVSSLHKETKSSFSEVVEDLYRYVNKRTNRHCPLIGDDVYEVVKEHADRLNAAMDYNRDYTYNYFGFKVSPICFYLMYVLLFVQYWNSDMTGSNQK